MKLYVASSWRNLYQPEVVSRLRLANHEVYDFRHPSPGKEGFSWASIDASWQQWSVREYRAAARHDFARQGFQTDFEALNWCEGCVLVLPSGVSAHLEAGWCKGAGKTVVVYAPELKEAELMYKLFEVDDEILLYESLDDVIACLDALP
jgi:hypothetical protein